MRAGFTRPVTSAKGASYVNDSADYFSATGPGRITHVAVQHWLGILPQRGTGSRACDFACSGTDRPSVVGVLSPRLGKCLDGASCMRALPLATLVKLRRRFEPVSTLVEGFDKLVDEIG